MAGQSALTKACRQAPPPQVPEPAGCIDQFSSLLAHKICARLFGSSNGFPTRGNEGRAATKEQRQKRLDHVRSRNPGWCSVETSTSQPNRAGLGTGQKQPKRPGLNTDGEESFVERVFQPKYSKVNVVRNVDISDKLSELFKAFHRLDNKTVVEIMDRHPNQLSAYNVIHSIVKSGLQTLGVTSQDLAAPTSFDFTDEKAWPSLIDTYLPPVVNSDCSSVASQWEVLSNASDVSDFSMLEKECEPDINREFSLVSLDVDLGAEGQDDFTAVTLETTEEPIAELENECEPDIDREFSLVSLDVGQGAEGQGDFTAVTLETTEEPEEAEKVQSPAAQPASAEEGEAPPPPTFAERLKAGVACRRPLAAPPAAASKGARAARAAEERRRRQFALRAGLKRGIYARASPALRWALFHNVFISAGGEPTCCWCGGLDHAAGECAAAASSRISPAEGVVPCADCRLPHQRRCGGACTGNHPCPLTEDDMFELWEGGEDEAAASLTWAAQGGARGFGAGEEGGRRGYTARELRHKAAMQEKRKGNRGK